MTKSKNKSVYDKEYPENMNLEEDEKVNKPKTIN